MSTRPHRSCREKSKKLFQGDSGEEEEDDEEKVDPKEEVPSQEIEDKDSNHDQEESEVVTKKKATKQRQASKRRRTNHVTEEENAVLLHAKEEIKHLKILSPSDAELTSKFIYQTVDKFEPVVFEKNKAGAMKPVGFRGLACKDCNTSFFYKNSDNYRNLASHYLTCGRVTQKERKERQAIKDQDKKPKKRKSNQDQMHPTDFYRMIFCRLHEVEDENEITEILENGIGMKPKEIKSEKPKLKRRKLEKEIETAQDESPKKKGRKIKTQEMTNTDKSTKAKGKRGRKQKVESTNEEEIEATPTVSKKKQKKARKGEQGHEIHMEKEKPKRKRGRPKKEKPDPKGIQEAVIVPTILNKLDFKSLTLPSIEKLYNNEQGLFGIIEEDEFCQYNVKFGSNSLIVLKTLGLSLYGDIDDKIYKMITEEEPLLRKQQMNISQTTVDEHSKYHGVICENNNLFAVEVPELDEWREETIIPKPITSKEARILLRGGLSNAYEAAQIYTFMVRCIYGKNEVMKLHQLYSEKQNNGGNAATIVHLGEESQDNTIISGRSHFDEEGVMTIEEDTTTVTKTEEGATSSDEKIATVAKASSDDEEDAAMPSEENTTTCTKALYQEVEAMLLVKNTTTTLEGCSVQEDTKHHDRREMFS
ncbi:predicted protein [Chaetoceros tenuissimus]|uniref:Uncharacterized protein n=1 Tax=Chaetoceros tenuissimus TaxID=426638 RepID=A0AAD3HCM5_9STRA|nr:predicted protein [Chaetoceros tenuissimus]